MFRAGSAIAVILVATCGATNPYNLTRPRALSQYAPLDASSVSTFGENPLEREVHRELLGLPLFGVFDHLTFTVDGATVILHGQVMAPELRFDAEDVVWSIPGVGNVVNGITFLPDSPADNAIRVRVFTAIYGHPSMSPYALVGSGGAIHVVVQSGRVSLEGQVGSNADARRAVELAAKTPGVVSLTSHIKVVP